MEAEAVLEVIPPVVRVPREALGLVEGVAGFTYRTAGGARSMAGLHGWSRTVCRILIAAVC